MVTPIHWERGRGLSYTEERHSKILRAVTTNNSECCTCSCCQSKKDCEHKENKQERD